MSWLTHSTHQPKAFAWNASSFATCCSTRNVRYAYCWLPEAPVACLVYAGGTIEISKHTSEPLMALSTSSTAMPLFSLPPGTLNSNIYKALIAGTIAAL